jgi:hypothetical protein
VSEYSDQIRERDFPPLARPSRDSLVTIATRAFWLEKGEDLPVRDPSSDLLLYWPLPPCFHSMYKNIDLILSDFADLELEVYGRSFPVADQGTLQVEVPSVDLLPPPHEIGGFESHPNTFPLALPNTTTAPNSASQPALLPRKKLRQSTLAQSFRIGDGSY